MTGEAAVSSARRGQRARAGRVALLVTLMLLLALVLAWDWNWFRGPIERRVSAATGRDFRIAGPLDVDFGRIVIVRVEDMSLANTRWSLSPEMARADLLRLEVPLWPLLRGERTLRRVDIVRPALLLERNRRGAANWQFATEDEPRTGGSRGWSFGELRVHDGRLDVRDAPLDTNLRLTIDSSQPQPGDQSVRLLVRGTGRYRGHPFQLVGTADSPVALLERADAAFRVDFSARAGATRGRLHGALQVPLDPARFEVNAEMRGNDLGDLYPLLGLAVPATPPYRVEGRLERKDRVVTLRNLRGLIGDSDVAGTFGVDLSGDRPRLAVELTSSHLDLDDLGGFLGLPPGAGDGESASPEQRAEAERRAASPRLMPDKEYDLDKLGSMDADFILIAADVDAGKWPIETLALRMRLNEALLQVDALELGFAGGTVAGDVRLDARERLIEAAANLALRGVDLEKIWPEMQPPNVGRINGRIDLQGRGNSVGDMFATADGEVQIGMGSGRFSNLLLELAGLDVAESLMFLLGKDKTVQLRCAYGDFTIEDGRLTTQALVFDTSDTIMFGDGSVDLGEEALALELRPEPKDFSPVSLRGPLEITGTLKDPKFRPQAKSLLGRARTSTASRGVRHPTHPGVSRSRRTRRPKSAASLTRARGEQGTLAAACA